MIELKLFPTDDILHIYIDEHDKFIKELGEKVDIIEAAYFYTGTHIIYLTKWNDKHIVHELSHVIDQLFKNTKLYGEELRAYYMGWLFKTIKGEYNADK